MAPLESFTNITLSRQLELKNLQLQNDLVLLDNIFQNTTDAIAVLHHEYYFIMLNNAFIESFSRIFSYKIKVKLNFLTILADYPELNDKIVSAATKAFSGQKTSITIENNSEKKDAYYCYEIYFHPICEIQSEKRNLVMTIRNITEDRYNQKEQAKQQAVLTHATRMNAIGEMAAALAHEINQPLAAINIYSHACLERFKDLNDQNNKLYDALKQICSLSLHAGEILHRMKNFIREGELCAEKNEINHLIQEAITLVNHQNIGVKFEIELVLEEQGLHVYVDKIKFMQVILNLAQNSVEASKYHMISHLKISIETKLIGDYIEVNFKDNGPGIPKELIDKIMKSYFTTKSHGTGLGLGICRTIIEAHGGKLMIKESSDKGAWIRFTLPVLHSFSTTGLIDSYEK